MNRINTFSDRTSYLSREEILNPFLVLEKVFKKYSTCEPIVDDLWELITHGHRKGYWTTYSSPKVLYLKYIQLVRIFEASLLISKIRPNYLDFEANERDYKNPDTIDKSKKSSTNIIQDAYKNLNIDNYYRGLASLKFDLSNLLYDGFQPTCHRYTVYIKETTYDLYTVGNKIISSLFLVYQLERGLQLTPNDTKRLQAYECNASDSNTNQFAYSESFTEIVSEEKKEFEYKPTINYLNKVAQLLLHEKEVYNPGNILHYFDELMFFLEGFWLHYEKLKTKQKNKKWDIPRELLDEVKYIPKDRLINPLSYLHELLEAKSLVEWRNELEEWKLEILGNEYFRDDYYRQITHLLFCLSELVGLMKHRPYKLF